MARKRVRKASKSSRNVDKPLVKGVVASERKMKLITNNLITFVMIFVVFLGLYAVSSSEFYMNLFWMISMLSGFLTVALVIVYLVFILMRYLDK